MKRDENIIPLSRDHHSGLLFCWKIRQGLKLNVDTERIRRYILYYWKDHLQKHFNEEESILFILKEDPYCLRAADEHRQIEQAINTIEVGDFDFTLLQRFTNMIDNHIRFEERECFPYLEKTLNETQLNTIGLALQLLHANNPADNYEDKFWVRQH